MTGISAYQGQYDELQMAQGGALAASLGPSSPFAPIAYPSGDSPAQQAQLLDVYDATLLSGSLGPPSSLAAPATTPYPFTQLPGQTNEQYQLAQSQWALQQGNALTLLGGTVNTYA